MKCNSYGSTWVRDRISMAVWCVHKKTNKPRSKVWFPFILRQYWMDTSFKNNGGTGSLCCQCRQCLPLYSLFLSSFSLHILMVFLEGFVVNILFRHIPCFPSLPRISETPQAWYLHQLFAPYTEGAFCLRPGKQSIIVKVKVWIAFEWWIRIRTTSECVMCRSACVLSMCHVTRVCQFLTSFLSPLQFWANHSLSSRTFTLPPRLSKNFFRLL